MKTKSKIKEYWALIDKEDKEYKEAMEELGAIKKAEEEVLDEIDKFDCNKKGLIKAQWRALEAIKSWQDKLK